MPLNQKYLLEGPASQSEVLGILKANDFINIFILLHLIRVLLLDKIYIQVRFFKRLSEKAL